MKPKIRIIQGGPQTQKKVEPDYQIDPSRSNYFMKLQDDAQSEIHLNDIKYILEPDSVNNQVNFQYWQFSFAGQGIFLGKKISGILRFPRDHPISPPKFYFLPVQGVQPIQHQNIYGDHLLCIPLLTHWKPQTTTMEILQAIEHIFKNPNHGEGDAPANPSFSAEPEEVRNKIQRDQAKFLPDFPQDEFI